MRARVRAVDPDREQRKRTQPAGIHGQDNDQLAQHAQVRGDAGRKADRAEGGDHLEQQLDKLVFRLEDAEQEGADAHHQHGQQRDHRGLAQHLSRQGAVERARPALGNHRAHLLHKGEKGRGFDAAAGRSGRRADEHQDDQHKQAGIGKRPDRVGGESRRTRGYAVKERAEPADILGCLEQQRAQHQQQDGCGKYDLGMQRQLAERAAAAEVQYDEESQPAEDDQAAGRQVEQDICLIRDQVAHAAQNVKSGVVERRDRVENTDPQRLAGRIVLCKRDKAEHHARALKTKRHKQNGFDQPHHAFEAVHVERFLDQQAAFDADAAAGGEDQPDADRGDAQSADLNQPGDYGLPEKREMIRRVDRDQTGDADRAGRSEQSVDKADLRARADRDRQQEQPSAEQDHECKAQCDQPAGRLPLEKAIQV